MEYFNNILCVEAQELISFGVMTENVYKHMVKRGQLNVIRRGCRNTPALVSVDSLPRKYYLLTVELIGDPKVVVPVQTFADRLVPDTDAYKFFITYRTVSGNPLPEDKVREYCRNAEVLNALKADIVNKRFGRGSTGGKRTNFWENTANTLAGLKQRIGHTLPDNPSRLKEKYKIYVKKGYSTLVSRKFGNINSLKVSEPIKMLILSLYVMRNNPYASEVRDLYMQFLGGAITVCDLETGELYDRSDFMDSKGNPITISESTVWNIINDPLNRAIVDKYRMGGLDYNNTHRPHHVRKGPQYSFSKISLDDRDLPRKMPDGTRVKAYYAYDVASGCVIGRAYSKQKTTTLFVDCIRDMIRFINGYHLGFPMEMEVEHHIVNQFEQDLMRAGVLFPIVRWCKPGNSQEKRAEHFNRAKKYGYEKRYQEGIGRWYARLEANRIRTEKVFDADNNHYKEKTYSFEELVADDLDIIRRYNNDLHRDQKRYPGKTRLQVLLEHPNPNMVHQTDYKVARYAGEHTQTSIRRSAYVRVQYQDYRLSSPYVLQDLEPNNYQVDAYYMPSESIERVYLFQKDVYIDTCHKVVAYNEATAEQTDADRAAYREQAKYVAQYDKMVKEGKKELAKVTIIENKESYASLNEELGVRNEELPDARRDATCCVESTIPDNTEQDEEEFDYADCVAWAKQAAIKSL